MSRFTGHSVLTQNVPGWLLLSVFPFALPLSDSSIPLSHQFLLTGQFKYVQSFSGVIIKYISSFILILYMYVNTFYIDLILEYLMGHQFSVL